MNRKLDREIETIFMMTGLRWFFVNSKIIKSAVKAGACVEGLVPDIVCEKLQEKLKTKKI
jgi:pantetheine-phosphate adenylyltransferase